MSLKATIMASASATQLMHGKLSQEHCDCIYLQNKNGEINDAGNHRSSSPTTISSKL